MVSSGRMVQGEDVLLVMSASTRTKSCVMVVAVVSVVGGVRTRAVTEKSDEEFWAVVFERGVRASFVGWKRMQLVMRKMVMGRKSCFFTESFLCAVWEWDSRKPRKN